MNSHIKIDRQWTLFLDRDGVINKRNFHGYITRTEDFEFLPLVTEAIAHFGKIFERIIVVTNQQGIGKDLMTHEDLSAIHTYMLDEVEASNGRIDAVYYCPHLAVYEPLCRKPAPGMALQAHEDFPEIDFRRSIMIGDSPSDMLFGKRLGMKTIYIHHEDDENADYRASSLYDAIQLIRY